MPIQKCVYNGYNFDFCQHLFSLQFTQNSSPLSTMGYSKLLTCPSLEQNKVAIIPICFYPMYKEAYMVQFRTFFTAVVRKVMRNGKNVAAEQITCTHKIINTASQRFITAQFCLIYAATFPQHQCTFCSFLMADYKIESYSKPEKVPAEIGMSGDWIIYYTCISTFCL